MKGKRFTDEQIAYALRQAENGTPVVDVCRDVALRQRIRTLVDDGMLPVIVSTEIFAGFGSVRPESNASATAPIHPTHRVPVPIPL